MPLNSAKSIPTLIHRSVLQAIAVAIICSFLMSSIYALVYHYQQQRLYVEQIAELLADSASNADGANLVARQVSLLLEKNPNIQSIVFYSTDHPMVTLNQSDVERLHNDWYNALFSNTISFSQSVISIDNTRPDTASNHKLSSKQLPSKTSKNLPLLNQDAPNSKVDTTNYTDALKKAKPNDSIALVGYINVTLDVHKLRKAWMLNHIWLWLATVVLTVCLMIFIIRKLSLPVKDIMILAKACDTVMEKPELKQLPIIEQHFGFQELTCIRLALITLFNRLNIAEEKIEQLAAFEEQLYNKDLSLDIQRSNFQGMITHELKTSLNAISGALQLLNLQNLTEEQTDVLAIIRQGSQHLDSTLEQIIQLNKIEKGQVGIIFSDFNPLQLLADLLSEFEPTAKHKGLELISRVQHIDYTVAGDVNKIKQILSTLIENAIKFTALGQVIVESQLNYFNNSVRWQIKVIDNGIGIDAKNMDDIFSPFFQVDPSHTREYGGLGVGLSVAKQIAQLIGASIEVISEPDVGSEFTVIMPLRNTYQDQRQYFLKGKSIIFYHHQEIGFIFEELQHLGASVTSQQHESAVLEQLMSTRVDMVMIAEDISHKEAAQLARYIRAQESTHRVLLVYWYAQPKAYNLDGFEYGLKAVGMDFCHLATRDSKLLHTLLKSWFT